MDDLLENLQFELPGDDDNDNDDDEVTSDDLPLQCVFLLLIATTVKDVQCGHYTGEGRKRIHNTCGYFDELYGYRWRCARPLLGIATCIHSWTRPKNNFLSLARTHACTSLSENLRRGGVYNVCL